MTKIQAAQRLQAAAASRWMRSMATNLGTIVRFGERKSEELMRKIGTSIEIDDHVADQIVSMFKKLGYKPMVRGKITTILANSGEGGLEIKYGSGEEAHISFFED